LTVPILSSTGESKEEGPEPLHEKPISKPLVDPRQITTEELKLFEIPDNLHGKHFLLSPDSDDESGIYEVIGYTRKRDKTVTYNVLFDDCGEVPVEANEMMEMLKDSLYFPA